MKRTSSAVDKVPLVSQGLQLAVEAELFAAKIFL
jgi:hypothetical protein